MYTRSETRTKAGPLGGRDVRQRRTVEASTCSSSASSAELYQCPSSKAIALRSLPASAGASFGRRVPCGTSFLKVRAGDRVTRRRNATGIGEFGIHGFSCAHATLPENVLPEDNGPCMWSISRMEPGAGLLIVAGRRGRRVAGLARGGDLLGWGVGGGRLPDSEDAGVGGGVGQVAHGVSEFDGRQAAHGAGLGAAGRPGW